MLRHIPCSSAFEQAIIWQPRSMPRLHVQVELCPRAQGHSTDGTSCLLHELQVIVPSLPHIPAALLFHQPVLVQIPLLPVRYPPMSGHILKLWKLFLAVSADSGAVEGSVMNPAVDLQRRFCADKPAVLTHWDLPLRWGFPGVFLYVSYDFRPTRKILLANWALCCLWLMPFKCVDFEVNFWF